jgi:hypothetical protein
MRTIFPRWPVLQRLRPDRTVLTALVAIASALVLLSG